jgi:5-formyltetrahydrofolate cyclo-ligase
MSQNTAEHLRAKLKTARKALSVAHRQRGSLLLRAKLFTWLATTRTACVATHMAPPTTVAAFWPLTDEPDLRALLSQWDDQGIEVLLPAVIDATSPLAFYRWHPEAAMVQGSFGVMELAQGEPTIPDVVLVPTLGFTPDGDRLGYGKGYYDRTLAALNAQGQRPITIGVAWGEANILDLEPDYAPSRHDFRLDAILTPDNWHPGPPKMVDG